MAKKAGVLPVVLFVGLVARADVLMDVEREIGLTRAEHWAGRKRHPAVVNSVTKLDSPDLISLAGEWAFTNCSHGASAYGAPRKAEKGHYLRSVEIPDSWAGKRVWLKIGGVTSQGWFFVRRSAPSAPSRPSGSPFPDCGSASARRALETGKMLVTLSGQSGEPNFRLGWWWIGKQCGTAIMRHPMIADLPYEPFLSPLLFRIIRTGTELPVADVSERDLVIAGEGGSAFYLYLSDSVGAHGAHHVRISGLDVVSDTPEGTALLDGVLGYLRRIAAETRHLKGGSENGKS